MPSASQVIIRKRVIVLFICSAIIMLTLTGRLAYLQFFRSAWLQENATDQRIRDIPVEAKRGMVCDRNGYELAISVSSDSVYAIPAEIQDADKTAAKMAAVLILDEKNWRQN